MSSTKQFTVIERPTFKIIGHLLLKFLVIEILNSILLLLKKKQTYEFDAVTYRGINLGSSSSCPKGWIGLSGGITIFLQNLPLPVWRVIFPFTSRSKRMTFNEFKENIRRSRIIHHNLYFGIPFRDESVSNVFSSHFFEHLTSETGKYVASEAFRVLKPGGIVRITVPCLDITVKQMKEAIQAYDQGNDDAVLTYVTQKYVRLNDTFSHHRHMYNFKSLHNMLSEVGFENIAKRTQGKGEIPDVELLDTRGGVFVEGIKPIRK